MWLLWKVEKIIDRYCGFWQYRHVQSRTPTNKKNQMQNLTIFIERENQFLNSIDEETLDITNHYDLQEIANCINAKASPENLHCDGEISLREANSKYIFLKKCAKELLEIDPTIKFCDF
jgi:hypothetical protein